MSHMIDATELLCAFVASSLRSRYIGEMAVTFPGGDRGRYWPFRYDTLFRHGCASHDKRPRACPAPLPQ